MITLPPEPASGGNILVWARHVQACLRRLRLTSGPGIRITEGSNGTAISADAIAGSRSEPLPFQLDLAADADTGELRIRIHPSTLAGGAHTDILGPDGQPLFSAADNPPALIEPSVGAVIGRVTVDAQTGAITERRIYIAAAFPVDTATQFHVQIGSVSSSGSPPRWSALNVRYGPITGFFCGSIALWA